MELKHTSIGFVFKDFNVPENKFKAILSKIERLARSNIDIVLFLCDRRENLYINLPKFYITAAFDYHGILISNDKFTAEKIRNYPDHNTRLYCMWDDGPVEGIKTVTTQKGLANKYHLPLISEELEYERFF